MVIKRNEKQTQLLSINGFDHFGTIAFLTAPVEHALIGEVSPIKSRQSEVFI